MYKQITDAIPKEWVLLLKDANCTPNNVHHLHLYDRLATSNKVIKKVYNMIIQRNSSGIEQANKVKVRSKAMLSEHEYLKAYGNINCVTNVTKLRDFQYRLMSGAVHCNNRLYYWNISDTKSCDICNTGQKQDIKHLLYDCKFAISIWKLCPG